MIRIKIETIPFAESALARWLIKLARWHNWNIEYKQFLSSEKWNFRIASKIATVIKTWEENKEATKLKKSLNPAVLKKVTRPTNGIGLDFPVNEVPLLESGKYKNSNLDYTIDEP